MIHFKVLVCGGRHYSDVALVFRVLDMLRPTEVIQGGATGADALAAQWAKARKVVGLVTCKADWAKHGKAAGPIRNQHMLDTRKPDLVVAFPGGNGTRDMIDRAHSQGFRTVCVGNWWLSPTDGAEPDKAKVRHINPAPETPKVRTPSEERNKARISVAHIAHSHRRRS